MWLFWLLLLLAAVVWMIPMFVADGAASRQLLVVALPTPTLPDAEADADAGDEEPEPRMALLAATNRCSSICRRCTKTGCCVKYI